LRARLSPWGEPWAKCPGRQAADQLIRFPVMDSSALRGIYVPIITPFAQDGSVAAEALERLAARLLSEGVAGLVPLGTTGEAPLMDESERRVVVETCVRAAAEHRAQLIVGAGSNSTAQTIAAVRALEGIRGLTGVLCLVPYYLRPSMAGITAHFERVADASPVPVVVYNIPFRTGQRADADTLLRLAQHENIVGVKQSVGAIDDDSLRLLAEAPEGFAVLGGDDAHLAELTLLGGDGGITASAHVRTPDWVTMVDAALEGRAHRARELHERLLRLVQACFAEPSPAVIKALLHARGEIPTPSVRLPFLPASEASLQRALAAQA
jgi:4-hydroxy-tetrahydrodipicolinate synthase